jgi:hypothetical protein
MGGYDCAGGLLEGTALMSPGLLNLQEVNSNGHILFKQINIELR